MFNKPLDDFMMKQLELCHDHMDQQSKKQDHIIVFYVSLLVLFVAMMEMTKISLMAHMDMVICFILIFVTWFLFRYLCTYVKWHRTFRYCTTVIANLAVSDIEIGCQKKLSECIRSEFREIPKTEVKFGSQTTLILCYLLLSLVPHAYLFFCIQNALWLSVAFGAYFFVGYWLIIFFVYVGAWSYYCKYMERETNNVPYILEFKAISRDAQRD